MGKEAARVAEVASNPEAAKEQADNSENRSSKDSKLEGSSDENKQHESMDEKDVSKKDGPHWECPACGERNSQSSSECSGCCGVAGSKPSTLNLQNKKLRRGVLKNLKPSLASAALLDPVPENCPVVMSDEDDEK